MKNLELAQLFNEMADILEFHGKEKDKFRIIAYRNAALSLGSLSKDVVSLAKEDGKTLDEIPGIGKSIAEKIIEFSRTGKIQKFEKIKKSVPKGLIDLLKIPGIGPKKLKKLYIELKIKNVATLKKQIKSGKVAELEGLGEKSASQMLSGIKLIRTAENRTPLGLMYQEVMEIIEELKKCEAVKKISHAGSLRRMKETIGDIDIQIASSEPEKVRAYFENLKFIKKIIASGETKISVITVYGFQIDIRIVKPKEYGSALQYFTGSKAHNVHLRTIAKQKGFKLSEYGIYKGTKRVGGENEEDMYCLLGMDMPPPEMREDQGEIELAIKHKIPKLIELKDIKGDLQMHSSYSDGVNTVEKMAEMGEKMGYSYLAITDHSPHMAITQGMTEAKIRQRLLEIQKVNKKNKIQVLNGAEVDILADGSLDYDDATLSKFDFVLAAIHSGFSKDNTERIIKAMKNPHVHAIAHPSGRLIGKREAYPLDMNKIFRAAAETKTAIEINAYFSRLDLKDIYLQDAKKAGVKFTIGTDAHSIEELWMMILGVGTARRGWLTKNDILNTLPLSELKKIL